MSEAPSTQAGLLAALSDLQHEPPFADLTIQLKDGPVRTSRILLAAMSPVFKMMALGRPAKDFRSLDMSHLSHDAWECITQFYLCNQESLSLETVADVLEVSDWYQLKELKECCGDFLTSCCSFENCLRVRSIAVQFALQEAAQRAMQVFTARLQAGCSPEAFLYLDKTELLKLLQKEELRGTEDDVCRALLAWMEAKMADADSCTEVFQHVKLRDVTDDFLVKHVTCHSVYGRTPALQSKVQDELMRRCQSSTAVRVQTAPPRCAGRGLLVVGCYSSDSVCTFLWRYCDKNWISLPKPEQRRDCSSAAAIAGDTVFITGWCDDDEETLCFDLRCTTWSTKGGLKQGRRCHSMAVVRDKVYVVGGFNGNSFSSPLSSIEEYCKTSGQWTHTADLQVATDNCGVTALGDTILVVGGDTDESASLIQTFNVETRTAAVLDVRLPRPMRHVRAAVLGNSAFFVGWDGDLVQITEVEEKLQMVSCVLLEGFPSGRSLYGVHVEEGCVRVIGGDWSKSVLCWTLRGQHVENHDVADLPEDLFVLAVGEVDVSA